MAPTILVIGKPNSGKSLLFSRLTGIKQKVANFPGITVELRRGQCDGIELIDYPGIYSFNPLTRDEEVAVQKFNDSIQQEDVSGVLCLLDATRLEQSLTLGLQAKKLAEQQKKPILFALNMMDECESHNISLDITSIAKDLGAKVIPISARTQNGLQQLKEELHLLASSSTELPTSNYEESSEYDSKKARLMSQKYSPKSGIFLGLQKKLDRFFLSSIFGGLSFVIIMMALFQSIFTWATPLMDFTTFCFAWAGEQVGTFLPPGIIRDFIGGAVFDGFGSFLVFVPQIFMLTFMIGLLEDSGYLARASIICHKPLSLFGLTGKSFVPYLSGHACAIPAILSARTIDSPKKRLLTMLTIPLVACSARLPVYSLLIAALIPRTTYAGGLFGLQGIVFFILYTFGVFMALLVSAIIARTVQKEEQGDSLILELPPYRLPHFKPLILRSLQTAKTFVTSAGAVIFSVTVIIWALGYFPDGSGQLNTSWLASLGQWLEPVFTPLGLDWMFGVAVLASFIAREVFVGTLGTLYGLEGAEENIMGLSGILQDQGITFASGISLLVLYAIALQCISTVAVLRKEIGNNRLPIAILVAYGLLAYLAAYLTYTVIA